MGGRGASSGGRRGRAPRGYRTVRTVHGIPVIQQPIRKSGLPTKARANAMYFGTNSIGGIIQLRVYGKSGCVEKDIDWAHSFDGHRNGTVHWHKWINGERERSHNPLTKLDISKYKRVIEEASGRKDLIWEW